MLPQWVRAEPGRQTRFFLHFTVKCRPSVMALNDSCHLLIETKHHFIQKSGGLEPLAP